MLRTIQAIIEQNGVVRLLEAVRVNGRRRALVTILDEDIESPADSYMLSESSLAKDWDRAEEDEAWSHLQSDPSS